jgi:hypothetical protein
MTVHQVQLWAAGGAAHLELDVLYLGRLLQIEASILPTAKARHEHLAMWGPRAAWCFGCDGVPGRYYAERTFRTSDSRTPAQAAFPMAPTSQSNPCAIGSTHGHPRSLTLTKRVR